MDEHKKFWVGFNLVKGIGPARVRALLDFFGDLSAAWQAPVSGLEAAGLSGKPLENLLQIRSENELDRVWEKIQAQSIALLTWDDESYPARLKEIDGPPPVLYLRGELLPEDEWAVAMVGTRRMTAYGRQAAEEMGDLFARHGVTVVSGLARGVDAVAHRAALQAGGRTLAVLGSGVDRIYPAEHRRLADRIVEQGAVISDYPPGTPPEAGNFPPRNRIISGLSRAVLVIEAGERSGALITASFAAEQGREVFALPGSIYWPQSQGPNRLIQKGAYPLLSVEEVLEVLRMESVNEFRTARAVLPADAVEAHLFALLSTEPVHVDDLRAQANMPIEKVTATLAMMELKGMVRQVGGMHYVAVRESSAYYGDR